MTTCGEFLVKQLEAWGVETVFGIPGVHTVELYRGLPGSRIRHVTPRHEQGAGFMADGYARVTGKPGVCFIITGPGMTNILTAMAQAYADSIPMLVISSVNERARLAHGNGYLHELPNQRNLVGNVCAFSHTLMSAEELPAVLARAFAVFDSERPRPVHIELPLDVITAPAEHLALRPRTVASRPAPALAPLRERAPAQREEATAAARRRLRRGRRRSACPGRRAGRADRPDDQRQGLLPADHPLLLGSNQSCVPVRELAAEADVVLAIGTELGETDYDVVFDGGFALDGELIRIDIDPQQLMRNYTPSLAIHSDARLAMRVLLAELPGGEASPDSPGPGAPPPCASAWPKTSPAGRTIASCSPRSSPSGRTPASSATRPRPSTAATTWSISTSRAAGSTPPPATAPSAMACPPPSAPSSVSRDARWSA